MRLGKRLLVLCVGALLLAAGQAAHADMIPVDATGYNQDVIVETGATLVGGNYLANVTATMDGVPLATSKTGQTWYQVGANTSAPTTGLPASLVPFVSQSDPTTTFKLQSGSAFNALLIGTMGASGTLTITAPTQFTSLTIAVATGVGAQPPTNITPTLHFSDSSSDTLAPVSAPDWFTASPGAYTANGRVDPNTGIFGDVNSGFPRIYQENLTLTGADALKTLTSISFVTSNTNANTAIFAVSGSPIPEPSTWAMMLLGLGGIALSGWRKRRKNVLAITS